MATSAGEIGAGETNAEAAQARLLAALACPLTNGPVEVLPIALAHGAVLEGQIFNRAGKRVGKIANFQLEFVRLGDSESQEALQRQRDAGALPRHVDTAPEWRLVLHDSPAFAYSIPPLQINDPEVVALDAAGSTILFKASGPIVLHFQAHP